MSEIVIFAGAGASKAVSAKKYPTTVEFFSSLPDEIKRNKYFQFVEEFVSRRLEIETIDIEHILWYLQELKGFCEGVVDPDSIVNWFFQGNRIAKATGKENQSFGGVIPTIKKMQEGISLLVDEINQQVYKLYSQEPNRDELEGNWFRLFDGIAHINSSCEVFTTNYDLVIEEALTNRQMIDVGWRGSVNRYLDTSLWLPGHDEKKSCLLTKLHGSINWSKVAEAIHIGDTGFKGSHDRHVIIYPGFKGQPREDHFKNFHVYFERSLARSKIALFIGFAFRDEYINEIIERSLPSEAAVCVINPQKVNVPFNIKEQSQIESSFDSDAVDEFVDYAKRYLGIDMVGPI